MVFVTGNTGIRLMPTSEYRARRLLKSGRAKIFKRNPFTIQLLFRENGTTQPVEYKCDTGYAHIGVSICTEKRELVNDQYDLLASEPERHNDRRKYRRARRDRLRHRAPRFNNRKGLIAQDGFAPSIRNRRDMHIQLFLRFAAVLPVTSAVFEMGQFDTQVLKAIEEGRPVPQGTDYQHGERYGIETLREAVFTRDGYKCRLCGESGIKGRAVLHVHHIGFWKHDRTDRLSNLMTVCSRCHTAGNHKPGGKLYGLDPELPRFRGATFMTMVRWDMLKRLKAAAGGIEVKATYGAATKLARKELGVRKIHANDAYCMGSFHPGRRTDLRHFKKMRRNSRILEKFYDAKVIDARTGKKASGAQLGCGRTGRSIPRSNPGSLRVFRGEKTRKGYRSVRKARYRIRPGTRVLVSSQKHTAKGVHCSGARVIIDTGESIAVQKVTLICHPGGWQKVMLGKEGGIPPTT